MKELSRNIVRVLGIALLLGAVSVAAQSLGEAARKERERKQQEQRRATRVYTSDDLKRAQILDPADRERFEAARRNLLPPSPAEVAEVLLAVALKQDSLTALAEPPRPGAARPALAATFRPAPLSRAAELANPVPAMRSAPAVTAEKLSVLVPPAPPAATAFRPATREVPLGDVARENRMASELRANSAANAPAAAQSFSAPAPPAPLAASTFRPALRETPAADAAPQLAEGSPLHARSTPGAALDFSAPVPPAPASATEFRPAPREIPLGDVARHYWIEKQLRQRPEWNAAPNMPPPPELAAPAAARVPPVAVPELRAAEPESAEVAAELTPELPLASPFGPLTHVRVAPGDSLWKLAALHLGDGRRWPDLAALNPQLINPSLVRIGEWVRLRAGDEDSPVTPVPPPSPAAAHEYRVLPGDSLWKLARARFGRGEAWTCIARANPQVRDADLIFPGQRLALPEDCSAGSEGLSARSGR